MTEATQEEADALLREVEDWSRSTGTSRVMAAIILDIRAYLARRPEPVDPDIELAERVASRWEGSLSYPAALDAALRAIKLSREKQ